MGERGLGEGGRRVCMGWDKVCLGCEKVGVGGGIRGGRRWEKVFRG